jgi:isoleucyl-tRNA synthetase
MFNEVTFLNYSDTVNLPNTDFSMKANLADNEPSRLEEWQDNNLYDRIQENRSNAQTFILHDGPPYANGDIHIGHALNKILKDILIKFKTMQGYRSPYRPGWDCHGLPIEHEVTSEQPETVEEGQIAIREACREYALKYVEVQKEQFKRLGILGEWDDPYLTLSADYEAEILRAFNDLNAQDYIYRQLKPVHWCWDCETALAEAEVEHDEITSPAVYVDFDVLEDPDGVLKSESTRLMIWTTTPWTLPANVAVAVHPEFTYVEFEDPDGESHLLAEPLLAPTIDRRGWSTNDITILQKINGSQLEGVGYAHPLRHDRAGQVVVSDIVTLEQGTGCVHLAPGHGPEDYTIGQEYDLPVESPVNADGTFSDEYPPQEDVHVLTAQDHIVDILEENGSLFYQEDITHSYPFCWRCGKPIIFRATPQWFLDVDHNDLRDRILETLPDIHWLPERGQKRFKAMVEDRPDWCLSRQRAWGVPIPAVKCNECGESMLDESVIESVIEVVEEEGVSAWFESDVVRFLPDDFQCSSCDAQDFDREEDILDVWFDSGVSHHAVLQADDHMDWPADVYLEGSDQHRGWFQLSMIPAMALDNDSPFRELITHGFVVDSNGEKMSKSKGNVVSPQDIVENDGADILRLWVASEDYHEDLVMGEELLDQVRDKYRRIRNTFKFLLGNLRDLDSAEISEESLSYNNLHVIDRWFLTELYGLVQRVTRHYQNREFHQALNEINNFCAVEASSLYIDISKDRLYCEPTDSDAYRSAITTLKHTLYSLCKLVAPVLSFTADEVWDYVPDERSIHETDWPDLPNRWSDDQLIDDFDVLRNLREDVMRTIENDSTLNDADEAEVTIGRPKQQAVLKEYSDMLPQWLLVAGVTLDESADSSYLDVSETSHDKCERCWRYRSSVRSRSDQEDDLLCDRCYSSLDATVQGEPSNSVPQ